MTVDVLKTLGRAAAMLCASALFALVVACATNTADVSSETPRATFEPTTVALAVETPTHIPRQHGGEHIPGLGDPLDAAHFVDSYPNHAQTLAESPARVLVNFDLALDERSRIAVERDGKPLAVGAVEFDARKIYMSARLLASEGDGLYVVKYRACVAGAACSDGQFGFRVDAASAKNYVDLTQQNEVTVHLKNVKYMPAEFIIRPGTRVVWVNDDPAPHFVNSDPHPSHNAFPQLNSLEIPLHGTYEFVFTEPGEYAFHCSAHVPQNMFGRIIVRADATQINATPTTVSLAPTLPAYGTVATPFLTAAPTLTPTIVPTAQPTRINPTEPTTTASPQKVSEAELPPQRFAAHFVSAAPEHAALLDAPPQKIELHFNFTLARNSSIVVRKDGEKLALGDLEFEANQLETANLR